MIVFKVTFSSYVLLLFFCFCFVSVLNCQDSEVWILRLSTKASQMFFCSPPTLASSTCGLFSSAWLPSPPFAPVYLREAVLAARQWSPNQNHPGYRQLACDASGSFWQVSCAAGSSVHGVLESKSRGSVRLCLKNKKETNKTQNIQTEVRKLLWRIISSMLLLCLYVTCHSGSCTAHGGHVGICWRNHHGHTLSGVHVQVSCWEKWKLYLKDLLNQMENTFADK